jgi:hypothetical protein
MEKRRSKLFGFMMVLGCLAIGTVAFAHKTGHESRTAADCTKLEGTATTGERGFCMKCINIGKTHYHPDCPAQHRCNLDNGKDGCDQQPPGWAEK